MIRIPRFRIARSVLACALLALAARALPASAVTLNYDAKGRTDVDKDRDAYNKPSELLEFWGVREGMKVMALSPGDGYTTQLYSRAVGQKGKVIAFGSYDHESFDKRFKPLNLANVEEVVMKEPEGFSDLTKELAKLPAAS